MLFQFSLETKSNLTGYIYKIPSFKFNLANLVQVYSSIIIKQYPIRSQDAEFKYKKTCYTLYSIQFRRSD